MCSSRTGSATTSTEPTRLVMSNLCRPSPAPPPGSATVWLGAKFHVRRVGQRAAAAVRIRGQETNSPCCWSRPGFQHDRCHRPGTSARPATPVTCKTERGALGRAAPWTDPGCRWPSPRVQDAGSDQAGWKVPGTARRCSSPASVRDQGSTRACVVPDVDGAVPPPDRVRNTRFDVFLAGDEVETRRGPVALVPSAVTP